MIESGVINITTISWTHHTRLEYLSKLLFLSPNLQLAAIFASGH